MAWPTVTINTANMDASSDNPGNARADIKQMADNVNAIKDSKGAAGGVAELDAGGLVPTSQLPTQPANKGGTGHTVFAVGDIFYANTTSTLAKLTAGSAGSVLTSNGPGAAPSYQVAGGVPSGTRIPFNQTTAPLGWTKDTAVGLNDSIMRIVTGSVGSGGSTAFSIFNGQVSTGSYTLTNADIPPHNHTGGTNTARKLAIGGIADPIFYVGSAASTITGNAGSGGAHSHSITTSIKYHDFIIATKD